MRKNKAYVHTKFDYFSRLWILITFYSINATFATSAANNGESNKNCRNWIAHTEGKICDIIQRGVFCAHKLIFPMLGHILRE